MITRADMMNKEHPATHADYYRDVIKAAGLRPSFPPSFIAVLKEEFEGGNVHFSGMDSALVYGKNCRDMNLRNWDVLALSTNTGSTHAVLKARGDYLTQAGMVCLIKELARMAVEEASQ